MLEGQHTRALRAGATGLCLLPTTSFSALSIVVDAALYILCVALALGELLSSSSFSPVALWPTGVKTDEEMTVCVCLTEKEIGGF